MTFDTLLVANRGEIACRVIRTARALGLRTVAVYSEADAGALHAGLADEAVLIGPAPAAESYLKAEAILAAAKESGAQAVHPGYGFLSENADFAEACAAAGLVFVGPPPAAIRAMGAKDRAKAIMEEAGVPVVPGYHGEDQATERLAEAAGQVGYPVMIKAVAGGGGKGMRLVEDSAAFEDALAGARREAAAAFGNDRVLIEKYLARPRHIEIQVFADRHGNAVHLFERDCSIQRRHQKVIEEAPAPDFDPADREAMGAAALRAAQAIGYEGAGTVEFLYQDNAFYFMEMNTRLQVEHPVTESITGLDLVAEQIRIAEGEALGYTQDDLAWQGHAIECRLYAEDPANNFLPDPGRLLRHAPPSGFGVRVDAGVEQHGEVLIHYDPMIAKLITWGRTRAEAIGRMERALAEYDVAGVRTTLPFCQFVMQHPAFRDGDFSTHFVAQHFDPAALHPPDPETDRAAALAAVLYHATQRSPAPTEAPTNNVAPAHSASRWRRRRGH